PLQKRIMAQYGTATLTPEVFGVYSSVARLLGSFRVFNTELERPIVVEPVKDVSPVTTTNKPIIIDKPEKLNEEPLVIDLPVMIEEPVIMEEFKMDETSK